MSPTIAGLRIGHISSSDGVTGLTVFLFDQAVAGGYWLCGSSPASRELTSLLPTANVTVMHALVFTGGSAYGLDCCSGVMQWLREHQQGYQTPHGVVPIVPTVAIYDRSVQSGTFPTSKLAYQACMNANVANEQYGSIGAAAGATVGKLLQDANFMTGGFGYAELSGPNKLQVAAFAVVNCVGDVINEQGQTIAGAIDDKGNFFNMASAIKAGKALRTRIRPLQAGTTLVATFSNAKLDRIQLTRIAKVACGGMARAISPVFTNYDGDIVFSISLGENIADEIVVGVLSAEAVRLAILHAVSKSTIYKNPLK